MTQLRGQARTTIRAKGRLSVKAAHVDWLRLVEATGPFLSLKVLAETFPQGLDKPDDEGAVLDDLRLALDGWDAHSDIPEVHSALVRMVLERVLEYSPDTLHGDAQTVAQWTRELPEHRVHLAPTYVVGDAPGQPALLITVATRGARLDRAVIDGRLSASPVERMRLLLRASGRQVGLVTNGEKWTLVYVPAEGTPTFATFDLALMLEDRVMLRAFRSLLGMRRVMGEADDATLAGLLERSSKDEREVTDALGDQTRRVVEMLVKAVDAADRDRHGAVLDGVEPPTLYEAAVAVAMRLIFVLSAEARDLLPTDGVWLDSYAVAPMRARLLEERARDTDDVLDRRFDAWPRLLATFRAIHDGVQHESVRLPGHGGGLFDPGRYPFLEAAAGRISNAVVLRILDDLQTLVVPVPGGTERRPLSFKALGVEQIGHVYERLLEHWAMRAAAPALGLAGKKEPEIALAELQEIATRGEMELIDWLVDHTGRTRNAVMKARALRPTGMDVERLLAACDNDDELLDRVMPFAGLVRTDHDGEPCVYLPGRIYVTERPGGRAFQSHYTPRSLTEPTVEYALEPVVYEGPAEGVDRADWRLRTPTELLNLKICDIACGSGAFLVAACRQLATLLVESWAQYPNDRPPLLPTDPEEQQLIAQRFVAERCLYGVDKNPLAIEIAKVSLWLTTLRRGQPFTFVDHALRCGDSLIGITDVAQLEFLSMDREGTMLPNDVRDGVNASVARARELRETIASTDAMDLAQVEAKESLLAEFERVTAGLRAVADLVVFAQLVSYGKKGTRPGELLTPYLDDVRKTLRDTALPLVSLVAGAANLRATSDAGKLDPNLHPLHWPLEFPEVFSGGRRFDVIVGNPPFLGGQGITGTFGTAYREHLVDQIATGARGSADLSAYFFLRAYSVLALGGTLSLVATNTIAQGDTREVGLAQMVTSGANIFRADPSRSWPSEANLEIAQTWMRKGPWSAEVLLRDSAVPRINSFLARPRRVDGDPYRLAANAGRSFQGAIVLGLGFVLTSSEAQRLIAEDPRNKDVLFPYLTGEDLQSRPDQSPSRWVINFFDWPLEQAMEYSGPFEVVERLVKSERQRQGNAHLAAFWWLFARTRPALTTARNAHVISLARTRHGNQHCPSRLPPQAILSDAGVAFVADDWGDFSVIQSALHEVWLWRQASSLETRIRYTPSDCFETFPFPSTLPPGDTGKTLHDYRAERTRARNEGLTALTNRINDPKQNDDDIVRLREWMVQMDTEVAAAYGWDDLDLDHGFHDTRIGGRFTICEAAREEVIDRLLELNHERYEEEVRQGLHAKKSGKGKAKKSVAPSAQQSLLGEPVDGAE